MDNNQPMGETKGKSKKLLVILGLVLVVAIIVVAAVMSNNKSGNNNAPANNATENMNNNQPAPPEQAANATNTATAEVAVPEALQGATVAVTGANPISKEGKVLTQTGTEVKNDVTPMSAEAPQQTPPVQDAAALPSTVTKLTVTASGWSPSEFTVKKGQAVTLAITSGDKYTHVFMFDDPALSAVAVGVSPGETRAITFNAPAKAGDYAFHCDVPGHAARGEVGKMIVQ